MANFTRIGYGQVEPNQLTGIKTGEIYASLPLDPAVNKLQNGEFMYYDYTKGYVTADPHESSADLEPMLVYNEIKIYEDYLSYKDFAMIRVGDNYVTNDAAVGRVTSRNADGTTYGGGSNTIGQPQWHDSWQAGYRMTGIAPRLVRVHVGNIYTTNMVATGVEYSVGDLLKLKKSTDNTLVLGKYAAGTTGVIAAPVFSVVKVYTMPDGQPGLKIQRVK
jgi:hypothetical protein